MFSKGLLNIKQTLEFAKHTLELDCWIYCASST